MAVRGSDQSMGDLVQKRVAHLVLVMKVGQRGAQGDRPGGKPGYTSSGLGTVSRDAPVLQPVLAQQATPKRECRRDLHVLMLSGTSDSARSHAAYSPWIHFRTVVAKGVKTGSTLKPSLIPDHPCAEPSIVT